MQIKKRDGFKNERHVIMPVSIIQDIRNHPLVENTCLLEVGYYPNARYHYRERAKGISGYILIYCLDGTGKIQLGNKVSSLKRGSLFVIPPHTSHLYYSDLENPWSILWIHFQTNLSTFLPSIDSKEIVWINTNEKNALLQKYFIDLFDVGETANNINTQIYLSQLLRLLMATIYCLSEDFTVDPQKIYLNKAMSYMHENMDQPITLNTLSSNLNISNSYLTSIFKKYTNKSPIDYLINMRVEQACKYLKLSEMNIYEIAKKCGYQDQYYFSRSFKKVTNYSPKDYRNFSEKIKL